VDTWQTVTHRFTQHQHLSSNFAIIALAVTFGLVIERHAWHYARNLITVAHEASHAVVAKLCFRKLDSIKLNHDTSGLTTSEGSGWGPRLILTTASGYPGPALMGLGIALLLHDGLIFASFIAAALVALFVLLLIRNLYGALLMILVAAGFFLAFHYLSLQGLGLLMCAIVFLLQFGSMRTIIELQRERKRGGGQGNDAEALRKLTLVPEIIWIGFFLCLSLAAWGYSLKLLFF
jgi:hypothetical protein